MININMIKGVDEYLFEHVGDDPRIEKRKYGGFAWHDGRKYLQYMFLVSYLADWQVEYCEVVTDGYMVKNNIKPEVIPA